MPWQGLIEIKHSTDPTLNLLLLILLLLLFLRLLRRRGGDCEQALDRR